MDERDTELLFRRGVEQFNAREFFAAHETWEEIWLSASEPDRTFLQGIIQVAAAFHHASRDNLTGARSLLAQGLSKLDRFPPRHRGVNLEPLRRAVREWMAACDSGKRPDASLLPRVYSVSPDSAE